MNILKNNILILGVFVFPLSGCSENPKTEAPRITATLIEETLNGLDLGDTPPQWVTSYTSGGRRKGSGGFDNFDKISTINHVSLLEEEKNKFYQAIISYYENSGFKLSGQGGGGEETQSYTLDGGTLEIHLIFIHLGTREGIELLVGDRETLDRVLIIEYSK